MLVGIPKAKVSFPIPPPPFPLGRGRSGRAGGSGARRAPLPPARFVGKTRLAEIACRRASYAFPSPLCGGRGEGIVRPQREAAVAEAGYLVDPELDCSLGRRLPNEACRDLPTGVGLVDALPARDLDRDGAAARPA